MATYGRNRDSVADIEDNIRSVFENHSTSYSNDNGDIAIPASSLLDVIHDLEAIYDGVELFSDSEQEKFRNLVDNTPGLEITPFILVQFIAERTKPSPMSSPPSSQSASDEDEDENTIALELTRGRDLTRDEQAQTSRSSSIDSSGVSSHGFSSLEMGTPSTPKGPSPFDAYKRQRSTPLYSSTAPTSYRRPAPLRRRKSDASQSDSESSSAPSSFGRTPSRHRAPSNPTSPDPSTAIHSYSRPHSRTQSVPQSHFVNSSLADSRHDGYRSDADDSFELPMSPGLNEGSFRNTIPLPFSTEEPEDEEDEEHLIQERNLVASTASLEPSERLEALQRANAELQRRLAEADKSLQNKLMQHEQEIEQMQIHLDDLRVELNASKREDKELRAKERNNQMQITALEAEITRINKQLEGSRTAYDNMSKLYKEQLTAAEQYRTELGTREELIRTMKEAASLHELESSKWRVEVESYESTIVSLQDQLTLAQQAHDQLSEQKQENLMLKETIDRMRFDMEELRNNLAGGKHSAPNSISRGSSWREQLKAIGEDLDEPKEEIVSIEVGVDSDESEEEIVTTRRRRHKKGKDRPLENKDYTHQKIQTDPEVLPPPPPPIETTATAVQTDKVESKPFSVQTEPEPVPPPKVMKEVEVVTELTYATVGTETEASLFQATDNEPGPSHPPTPPLNPHEKPPAYDQIDPNDWSRVAGTLKKWHQGLNDEHQVVEEGISLDAIEEWKALKEELGVSCDVIDKIIDRSTKTRHPRTSRDGRPRRGKLYNIYNTYFVSGENNSNVISGVLVPAAVVAGASALVYMAVSPHMVQPYEIPGGPTYYDRAAWSSFNTLRRNGEGFSPDGTAVVWNFLGRVGQGAARVVRGWPT